MSRDAQTPPASTDGMSAPSGSVDLDYPDSYAALDSGNMLGHIQALPRQLEDAWRLVATFAAPPGYDAADAIVVAGMGGSAIGADLARGLVADTLRVPLVVWRDYGLPAFAGPRTLVIASSHSGGTEETLSAVERALTIGAPLVAVTTGGRLASIVSAAGHPVVRFDYPSQPRAAIGYALVLVLGLLARLGYVPDQEAALGAATVAAREAAARFGPSVPTATNAAKELARELHGRVPIFYGGGFLVAVARRWKGQCNENAKHWAFFEELPELDHNAVMGYQFPADAARQLRVVLLCSALLSPRLGLRCQVTAELLARHGIPHTLIEAWGDGPLAHLVSALAHGDWTSYYLALLNGVDPTGIAAIDYLKARLAEMS
jgi:glucose/mannose-6-phosphate isomerase